MLSTSTFHHHHHPLLPALSSSPGRRRRSSAVLASLSGGGGRAENEGRRAVDESLVVLRMRIKELKAAERCDHPPSHWMEWEKRYAAHNAYGSDVCDAVGLLQNRLMDSRPSLALGAAVVVLLSLLFSAGVVLVCGVEIVRRFLGCVSWLFFLNL
ncbi:unnamed protein product [Linum tenue]|uniref:Uncharacterized protein n=2 Tax=Linum tenue TaxID=586396 RepID=A0AAV0S1S0_9ROSI|nr:unnamed protein product [Linum tenue]